MNVRFWPIGAIPTTVIASPYKKYYFVKFFYGS
jgi:hypothetical protein